MTAILVTGGTGTLGRPTVERLRAAGHDVRVLSRRAGADIAAGDLLTGAGLPEAIAGTDIVLHLATDGRRDVAASKNLIAAANAAGGPHLIYISIVGIDRIPFGYYRSKFEVERLLESSGLPFTILRATQFHNLVAGLFSAQRRLPALFAPSFSFQPIEVQEVAQRLVELAVTDAAGRVPDIGGPEVRTARTLAQSFLAASGSRRPVWPIRLPGKIFRAVRSGANLVPGTPYGATTFEQFLAEQGARKDRE